MLAKACSKETASGAWTRLGRRGHRFGQKRMQAGKNVAVAKLEGTCVRKQAWSRQKLGLSVG